MTIIGAARTRHAAAILLAALLVFAIGAPAAGADELKPWRHGIIEAKSDAGIIMMVTKGFAAKQGLKLEITQFKADVIGLMSKPQKSAGTGSLPSNILSLFTIR